MSIASLLLIAHDPGMAKPTRPRISARITRLVDNDLAEYPRTVAHILGFLPILAVLLADAFFGGPVITGAWALAIGLCVAWTLFVLWRGTRLIRAMSIKGDRDFDRKGKFFLSPEYHRSESVTETARRKRSKRSRSGG